MKKKCKIHTNQWWSSINEYGKYSAYMNVSKAILCLYGCQVYFEKKN